MKLLTFENNGTRHIGALLADSRTVSDFTASEPSAPHFRDMLSLIDAGAEASAEARDLVARPKVRLALSAVRLLAPIPEPRQMRDFLCFEKHLRQRALIVTCSGLPTRRWIRPALKSRRFGTSSQFIISATASASSDQARI